MNADRLLVAIGALCGATGLSLLAIAAHGPFPVLDSAAKMLLGHAGALIALAAASSQGLVANPLGRLAGYGLAFGTMLFSLDMGARALGAMHLFPMAAPAGGAIAIASWLLLAVAALISARRHRSGAAAPDGINSRRGT